MGILVDGKWRDEEMPQEVSAQGEFRRSDSRFRSFITANGESGFPAQAGRYHLSVAYASPGMKEQGWTYEDNPKYPESIPDRVNGFHYLHEAYSASDPHYTGK